MPRYYFHIRQGNVLVEDSSGVEVSGAEGLEDEAIEAARDLLADGDLQGLDRRDWVYEVADESGATVLTLPFSEAVEPDLPPQEV
jgi:Ser/Thr protein kinase RdoA (MazF antagonist)